MRSARLAASAIFCRRSSHFGQPVDEAAHWVVGPGKEAGVDQGGLEGGHLQAQQLLLDGVGNGVVFVDVLEHLGHGFDDQPVQRCAVRLGGGRRLLAHFLNQHAHVLVAVGLLGTGLQLVEYGHQLVGGSLGAVEVSEPELGRWAATWPS